MAKDEEEQQSRGFKVQDRRRFVDDADADADAADDARREEPPPTTASRPSAAVDAAGFTTSGAASAASAAPAGAAESPGAAATSEAPFGEMSFTTFVMGLTTQALMHLGEIPDPVQQSIAHDLPAAKQMIDLLAILREKTKGNLDPAEDQLLGEVLYDLRMRYVELARGR